MPDFSLQGTLDSRILSRLDRVYSYFFHSRVVLLLFRLMGILMRIIHNRSRLSIFTLAISVVSIFTIFAWPQTSVAQENIDLVTPESLILSNQDERPARDAPTYSSYTKYETTFLPGLKSCVEDSTSQALACQEAVIQGLSTSATDYYQIRPRTVVEDEVQPRGNILQIKFDKRIRTQR